jgi:transcriptional regulator with XRE-family HTH domain
VAGIPVVAVLVLALPGYGWSSMPTAEESRRRKQLRDFLKARRAAVTPQSVGLSPGSRRRTPGLRREEVAAVAGVGVTWYTWLEQGRDIRVSPDTLDRIALALRLTPTDIAHLFFLAGVGRPERPDPQRRVDLDQEVRRVLDAFSAPAFVIGPQWDVEAYNAIADRIYRFRTGTGRFARNHVWRFFMDPDRRRLYLNWDVLAEKAVGLLRTNYVRRDGDSYFEDLVRGLIDGSPQFRELWEAQGTAPMTPDRAHLAVPGFGELRVTSIRLSLPGWDDYVLFLLPPDDERSAGVMARIAGPEKKATKPSRGVAARARKRALRTGRPASRG